jgi:iron complex outermembrane receptor protein
LRNRILTALTATGALLGLAFPVWAQNRPSALANCSLEDLMKIVVTSVSKKQQSISPTASAVFVITQEEILLSGETNIPDLLRMIPGLDVTQINASKWPISARGFNGQYSNKLPVLIDGRTGYKPLLSGVFWDTENIQLEDIGRIEVICGVGATVGSECGQRRHQHHPRTDGNQGPGLLGTAHPHRAQRIGQVDVEVLNSSL